MKKLITIVLIEIKINDHKMNNLNIDMFLEDSKGNIIARLKK